MRGRLHHEVYARIAAATKASIALLGGSVSVGNMFGMCRQNVERWYRMDVDTENRFIPLAKLVELEHEVASSGGIPQVIKALADECGFDLVRRSEDGEKKSPVTVTAHLMSSAGEACKTIADACEDLVVTDDEREECKRALQDVIQRASDAISSLENTKPHRSRDA